MNAARQKHARMPLFEFENYLGRNVAVVVRAREMTNRIVLKAMGEEHTTRATFLHGEIVF